MVKRSKKYFYQKEAIKIGVNYVDFSKAIKEPSFKSKNYFLIASSFDFNRTIIEKALELNIEIVISVNEWSYRQRSITDWKIIKNDIQRMIDSGVKSFLIDATFEPLFNFG